MITVAVALTCSIKWKRDSSIQLEKVRRINESEELILRLQRALNEIAAGAKNLRFPDWKSGKHFASPLLASRISDGSGQASTSTLLLGVESTKFSIEGPVDYSNIATSTEGPLDPLLSKFRYLDRFKLKIVEGEFSDSTKTFRTLLALSGAGKGINSGGSFQGHATAVWQQSAESSWQIIRFEISDLVLQKRSELPFFAKSNWSAIKSGAQRKIAETCVHEELVKTLVATGGCSPPGGSFQFSFDYDTVSNHPGISVVDINGDGWDDFYVMARWGKNLLFVNQKDGSFEEQANRYGLDILNHCTCAAFADFDNDGDPDLMLGRSFARSQYLENSGGRFIDASSKISFRLPAMVSSISVADYNRDGLLDAYIGTFGSEEVAKVLLSYEKQKILAKKSASGEHHELLNTLGVPNLLLVNKGNGQFDEAPESVQLEFWQTTFCATWVDYDRDGDPDIYVTNDFGPDALMRNDYPEGFKDVTREIGHPTMAGFGMGSTWGDYDLDGEQDLYISNMYSKAGLRITKQIKDIDSRFEEFVNGNRLYRQSNGKFEYTSGLKPPKHLVAKVGWSWGGQFADFDNNGYLDIYVTSGCFTAPEEVARQDDL